MAPLDPSNTGRVYIDYTTGGGTTAQNHTVMARFNSGVGGNFAGALSMLGFVITEMGATAFFDGWQATGARYSLAGQNISNAAPLPAGLIGFVGAGQATATRQSQARQTKFVGRSPTDGRRVSFGFYGLVDSLFTEADFRVARTAENFVGAVLDVLEEADAGYFVAIGLAPAVWKEYADWQYNSYWEGELRT